MGKPAKICLMNFDWLVSLSTALFASVIGVPTPAVKTPKIATESREKIVLEKPVDTQQPATEADFVKEFNGILHGKFVPRQDLEKLAKKKLTKKVLAENLLEKVEEKLPPDFEYPPIKEVIKFRDISPADEVFPTAQKLRALEILPENDGFFGQPNDKNPVVKINEMKQLITKAFNAKGELNYLTDKDLDGIPNALDACPDIPAKNGGCPKIKDDSKFPNDTILKVADEEVKVVDEKEIQLGDKFAAIIFDPVSGEIYTQSDFFTVTK